MQPDFESHGYNYRQQKFSQIKYDYDPNQGKKYAALATKPGVLPETNGAVELTEDNKLIVQLFDAQHDTGFFVDSFGSFYGRWIRSLNKDEWKSAADVCNTVGLVLLDNRAAQIHGYAASPLERDTPPNKQELMPTLEEWIQIWHKAMNPVITKE